MKSLLSTQQAAEILNISRASVMRYINQGRLPAHQIAPPGGGNPYYRVKQEDLENFLNDTYTTREGGERKK